MEITKQEKRELLIKTYKYKVKNKSKDEVLQFNFANKLISTVKDTLNKQKINRFTYQNTSNILNNLSNVGLTSKDL